MTPTTTPTVPRVAHAVGDEPLRQYEMWVKTVLSPALIASFPLRADTTPVPRRSIRRLRIRGDRDLTTVVRRLAECGVEVVDLRVVGWCA